MTTFLFTMLTGAVVALWCRCSHLDQQVRQMQRHLDTQDYRVDILCDEMDALACGLDEARLRLMKDSWALTEETVISAIQDLANRCATLEARRTLSDMAHLN